MFKWSKKGETSVSAVQIIEMNIKTNILRQILGNLS